MLIPFVLLVLSTLWGSWGMEHAAFAETAPQEIVGVLLILIGAVHLVGGLVAWQLFRMRQKQL